MRDSVRKLDGRTLSPAHRSKVVRQLIVQGFVVATSNTTLENAYDRAYRLSPAGRRRLDALGGLIKQNVQAEMFDIEQRTT